MMKSKILPWTIVFIMVASISCQRRELFAISEGVVIDQSFQDDVYGNDLVPTLFRVLAYDRETGRSIASDFISSDGGAISIPSGEYDILTYSYGSEYCIVGNEDDRNSVAIYTSLADESLHSLFASLTGRNENAFGVPVVFQPDFFWKGTVSGKKIPYSSSEAAALHIQIITEPLVRTGHFTLDTLKGMENIVSVKAFLTNMARSVNLFTGKPSTETAVICFNARSTSTGIEAYCRSFGTLDTDSMRNELYLLFTDSGGGRYLKKYDVTGQLDNSSDDVSISLIDHIEFPEPERGGGGFAPSLGDWQDVLIPIDL